MDQLDMFSVLDRTGGSPQPRITPPTVKKTPPLGADRFVDGIEYLKMFVADREHLIFLYGGNPHLRFARTWRSYDPASPVPEGFPVDYHLARSMLTDGGYYCRGTADSGQKIGQTGNNLTAEVWRR